MRILVATHYFRPHRGGIETVAFEQCKRLVARGHEVSVLSSRLPGDPALLVDAGIEVHRERALNPLERRGVPYPIFSPQLSLRALALARRHDVALAHSHTFLSSVAVLLAARACRKRAVLLQHNTYVEYPQPWRLIEDAADRTLGALSLRLAHARLAVSDETRRYLERIRAGPCGLLRNGVETARFRPAREGEKLAARRALGLPESGLLALCVRRLSFKNGVDTLLDAARLLRAEPGIHLCIAGAGPDRAALDRAVAEQRLTNVTAVGFVADEALPDCYRAADVFVLPSRSGEGLPMVVLEAFATGLPCAATRAGGQVELVKEAETGWLFEPGDAAALARILSGATRRPGELSAFGAAARRAAQELDWERNVTQLEQALSGI